MKLWGFILTELVLKYQEVGFCLSIHAEELRPFFFINIIFVFVFKVYNTGSNLPISK